MSNLCKHTLELPRWGRAAAALQAEEGEAIGPSLSSEPRALAASAVLMLRHLHLMDRMTRLHNNQHFKVSQHHALNERF